MKTHKAALAMPEMSKDDFAKLKADISKHGLLCPVETLNGEVIDGRHRLKACRQVGIEPELVEANLNGQTPEEYVWSLNGERRHLTASQRAAVATLLWPAEKVKAKDRKRGKGKSEVTILSPQKSRASAGKKAGVSGTYVQDAAKLKKDAPKLFNEVKQGTKTLQQAKRQAKPKRRKRSVTYPLSTGVMKMLSDMVAASNMVKMEHDNDFKRVVINKKFDPDKRLAAVQLVDGLSDTLAKWRQQCNTIINSSSANSSTNTGKQKASR